MLYILCNNYETFKIPYNLRLTINELFDIISKNYNEEIYCIIFAGIKIIKSDSILHDFHVSDEACLHVILYKDLNTPIKWTDEIFNNHDIKYLSPIKPMATLNSSCSSFSSSVMLYFERFTQEEKNECLNILSLKVKYKVSFYYDIELKRGIHFYLEDYIKLLIDIYNKYEEMYSINNFIYDLKNHLIENNTKKKILIHISFGDYLRKDHWKIDLPNETHELYDFFKLIFDEYILQINY